MDFGLQDEAVSGNPKSKIQNPKSERGRMVEEEQEYPYWRRVYIIVLIYTAVLIAGLWTFSRIFS